MYLKSRNILSHTLEPWRRMISIMPMRNQKEHFIFFYRLKITHFSISHISATCNFIHFSFSDLLEKQFELFFVDSNLWFDLLHFTFWQSISNSLCSDSCILWNIFFMRTLQLMQEMFAKGEQLCNDGISLPQ